MSRSIGLDLGGVIRARAVFTREWIELAIEGTRLVRVDVAKAGSEHGPDNLWVAPAFWDIQTNGRWGISFSDASLTPEQVAEVVLAQAGLGTARLCPTLITGSDAAFQSALRAIGQACERWPEVERMVTGIHLEGPFLSELDGYRGAHPLEHIRDPDITLFETWQRASGGRVKILTLAPERTGAIEFIRELSRRGVVVAIGHTAADAATIHQAAAAGARLSTHLGNGLASPLPRHPNPLWSQAAEDRLSASLIADAHHLGPEVLKVLVRAKGIERILLVSDASPLAGLPPGIYGPWAVDPGGKVVVAGTTYLAGSYQGLVTGVNVLCAWGQVPLEEALACATSRPARLLGCPAPRLATGEPASFNVFRRGEGERRFELLASCVDGRWTEADRAP